MAHIHLHIAGMTCQVCANRLEKVLNKKDFIHNAVVNFAAETAQIDYDDSQVNIYQLIELIKKIGFMASIPKPIISELPIENYWHTWVLLVMSLPFAVGMLGMLFGSHKWMPPITVQIVLASIVQTYFAWPFYRRALASLRDGLANMDVLISLGTLAIYGYSMAMVWLHHDEHNWHQYVYFEAGVMVLTFVSLGKYWEGQTKRGSLNALNSLLKLTPNRVYVLKNDDWQLVSIDSVQIGDVLRCVNGERVAADGVVVSGETWADESYLTGESQPVYKEIGSRVWAGSVLSGSLNYRVEALGSNTLLGDMTAALAEAQASKAPIARLADQIAAIFVPVVLFIALLSLLFNWFLFDFTTALMRAVAVLVVACPCALGLATPAAIMAGMGLAVQRGVWFKHAAALERAGQVSAVVLDKTGTLTLGKPNITAIWTTSSVDEQYFLRIAASVASHAAHPLAQAIVDDSEAKKLTTLPVNHIHHVAGEGVIAEIAEVGTVKMGKLTFAGFRLPEHIAKQESWQVASIVAISSNNQALGAFALLDSLKPDSINAIKRLQQNNIKIHVLSGDNDAVVRHIAQQLGLSPSCVYGNQSPREKADFIAYLQRQNDVVAMVGDGVNDAPALALADVGFAIRGHTDMAEYSADAILVQASLNQWVDGLMVAQATLKTIKQNLFFALIYNVLGIPLAAIGLLTPVLAAAMMTLSSVSVLLNALKLKKFG